jgi:hypothetical protein
MKAPAERGAPSKILAALQTDLEKIATEAAANPPSSHQRRQLDKALRALSGRIEKLLRDLDPIQHPTAIFDPNNPKIVGRFIALALVAQQRQPLGAIASFYGSGVYGEPILPERADTYRARRQACWTVERASKEYPKGFINVGH